jgi:hypothetical protein
MENSTQLATQQPSQLIKLTGTGFSEPIEIEDAITQLAKAKTLHTDEQYDSSKTVVKIRALAIESRYNSGASTPSAINFAYKRGFKHAGVVKIAPSFGAIQVSDMAYLYELNIHYAIDEAFDIALIRARTSSEVPIKQLLEELEDASKVVQRQEIIDKATILVSTHEDNLIVVDVTNNKVIVDTSDKFEVYAWSRTQKKYSEAIVQIAHDELPESLQGIISDEYVALSVSHSDVDDATGVAERIISNLQDELKKLQNAKIIVTNEVIDGGYHGYYNTYYDVSTGEVIATRNFKRGATNSFSYEGKTFFNFEREFLADIAGFLYMISSHFAKDSAYDTLSYKDVLTDELSKYESYDEVYILDGVDKKPKYFANLLNGIKWAGIFTAVAIVAAIF